jgi:hypothetical protein
LGIFEPIISLFFPPVPSVPAEDRAQLRWYPDTWRLAGILPDRRRPPETVPCAVRKRKNFRALQTRQMSCAEGINHGKCRTTAQHGISPRRQFFPYPVIRCGKLEPSEKCIGEYQAVYHRPFRATVAKALVREKRLVLCSQGVNGKFLL